MKEDYKETRSLKSLTPLEKERQKRITISWFQDGKMHSKTVPKWKDLFELKKIESDGGKDITTTEL